MEYQIIGKFKMIQFGVFSLSIPPAIINLIPGSTEINIVYNDTVMNNAYNAIISIVLYTSLSPGFRRVFNLKTAKDALENAQNQSIRTYTQTANDTDYDEEDK